MNIIVLQHIKIEDPGYIKDLMLADGFNLITIELDEGERIPDDLSKFDGMFCMGGPMDTYMEKEYPWLIEEKKAIKEFVVNLNKPYLGFCLGCQLLGEVVGGKVVKSKPAEIGIMDINFSNEKNEDKLFSKFPNTIKSLQWHSYEVQGIENNKDITLLASSPITKYQIFKYQNHAYGIQFHIEIKFLYDHLYRPKFQLKWLTIIVDKNRKILCLYLKLQTKNTILQLLPLPTQRFYYS